jgi:AcrR family transcriptional regulator
MDGKASPSGAEGRRYRGITGVERREHRRERLLEAGLELFGTRGYADTSVSAVCAAAGLNRRYFYESFDGSEDLLREVYEAIVAEIAREVIEVTARAPTIDEQARAGLTAAWNVVREDPRKARILAVEVVGVSDRLERLRRRNRHAFADILVHNAFSLAPPDMELRLDPVLNARALMGACMELMVDWVNGEIGATPDEVVDYLTHLLTTSAYSAVVPRPEPRATPRARARPAKRAAQKPGARRGARQRR